MCVVHAIMLDIIYCFCYVIPVYGRIPACVYYVLADMYMYVSEVYVYVSDTFSL